ncbi:MAG TPA: restriction endonuclease subunit S [Paludibacteraceae bacterium]|nr:restriction endonuclease subunit S [Paludibacteraceae bacterium]HPQ13331.1 restriction endonuclease subunit S [Paludibacteraceae bacterium]
MNSINDEILLPQGYKMTELGPLPEEWEVVKLGEVCKVDWGNTSLTKKLYTANGYPAFSAAGNDGFLDFYEHDGEAVILSAIGARSGKCFYASGKWTAIKNTIVIKSNNETKINLLFLYFFVNNENYWHKSGSGQPFISIGVAQKQKLPLPPLPEQQKMAAVLSAVQEAKEKTRAVIDATKALKKSMMKHLFTYGPVSPEEAENVPLKETEIGKVPEEWEVVKLGELAEVKYGKACPKEQGNVPVIGSGGIYFWTNNAIVEFPTIIIGRKGTAGKVWLSLQPCYPSDTTFYLKWLEDKINIKFIFEYLNINQLSGEHAKTTLPSLQRHELEKFLLPLPPLPVQQKIASILSAIDEKIQAEEAKKKALEDLFRSLLSHLMSGKIRVKDLGIGNC